MIYGTGIKKFTEDIYKMVADSDYIFEYQLTADQKQKLILDLAKGKDLNILSKKYNLSVRYLKRKAFVFNKHKPTIPISFRSKRESYYEDEMSYGELNLKYKYNEELEKERPSRKRDTHKGE